MPYQGKNHRLRPSPRMDQVYLYACEDALSFKQIADRMNISTSAVKQHMIRKYRRLGVVSLQECIIYYWKRKLALLEEEGEVRTNKV